MGATSDHATHGLLALGCDDLDVAAGVWVATHTPARTLCVGQLPNTV